MSLNAELAWRACANSARKVASSWSNRRSCSTAHRCSVTSSTSAKWVSAPTTSTYDCRPYNSGNTEDCTFNSPSSGTYHIMVRAYSTYSGVTVETVLE